jgi:fermentation-respiration switch protein FrsA (DUF1100 family)
MIKAIGITLLVLGGIYLAALASLVLMQRSFLYFPMRETMSPAEAGFAKAQVLSLQTPDGDTLVTWYVPAETGKPLLLYFHGNGGGLSDRAQRFTDMTADGDGLLAIAYRSYFGSTGSPSEAGLHMDAETAYAEAIKLGYSPTRIVAVGESLGTGVAVALAAEKPVAALILDSPYTSILDIAKKTYWMFPTRLMMLDQYHSDDLIGQVHVPVMMVHGAEDGIIPLQLAKELFARANEPKTFIEVPAAGHMVLGRPDVLPRVMQWLDATVHRLPVAIKNQ